MWENERKKTVIRNIIIFLLLIAFSSVMVLTIKAVNEKIAMEDALLHEEHSNRRQELSEARQENMATVQQIYDEDMAVVAKYLPGIVCWGDNLTAGSYGNVSYPRLLQKYIDTYLCEIYDLRYSLDNTLGYPNLNWDDYKISIPVINMGSGKENNATILGRSGVLPYVVNADFVIPADKKSVAITIASQNGQNVNPLTGGNTGVNPVTIAGVEGTLTLLANNNSIWGAPQYEFTRTEDGQETPVAAGTEITTAGKEQYRDYLHIVWIGTYEEYVNPATLVNETKALLQRQTLNSDRYIVIGPCTFRGIWGTAGMTMDSIDSAMMQAFGDHYISFRKYLLEDGMHDAGIDATREDQISVNGGQVPNSFRSTVNGAELSAVAYELLGRIVYDRMDFLGYFDEVREELNLDKITQALLEEDINYFDRRMSA